MIYTIFSTKKLLKKKKNQLEIYSFVIFSIICGHYEVRNHPQEDQVGGWDLAEGNQEVPNITNIANHFTWRLSVMNIATNIACYIVKTKLNILISIFTVM